jgi:hypothetical protein
MPRRRGNSDSSEGIAGILLLGSIVAIYLLVRFVRQYFVQFVILIVAVAIIALIAGIALYKKHKEQLELYRIQEEERRLREEAEYNQYLAEYRKRERLNTSTPLYSVADTMIHSVYRADLTWQEARVIREIESMFSPHAIFADVMFRTPSGRTSQTDIIAVGKRGVLVFECKDIKGWIFGNGNTNKWMQILAYGREKYQFYNPIKQNNTHISVIKNIIKQPKAKMFNIIVFSDNAEFKKMDFIPEDCYLIHEYAIRDCMNQIIFEEREVLTLPEVEAICENIKRARIAPTSEAKDRHIADIENMFGSKRVF